MVINEECPTDLSNVYTYAYGSRCLRDSRKYHGITCTTDLSEFTLFVLTWYRFHDLSIFQTGKMSCGGPRKKNQTHGGKNCTGCLVCHTWFPKMNHGDRPKRSERVAVYDRIVQRASYRERYAWVLVLPTYRAIYGLALIEQCHPFFYWKNNKLSIVKIEWIFAGLGARFCLDAREKDVTNRL